jgi:hypothetical protein
LKTMPREPPKHATKTRLRSNVLKKIHGNINLFTPWQLLRGRGHNVREEKEI